MKRAKNLLFDNSPDGLLIIHNNLILECNESAVRALGCKSRTEVIGKNVVHFSTPFQPDGLVSQQAWNYYADETLRNGDCMFEWTFTDPSDEDRWFEIMISTLDGDSGRYLANLRDISERKQQENKLSLRSERIIIQNQILTNLSKLSDPELSLEDYFELFTNTIGEYSDIDRACVWLLKPSRNTLFQTSVYSKVNSKTVPIKIKIAKAEYPRFFSQFGKTIIGHNALTDNRTNEFRAAYLDPNGIKSILFSPILSGQKLLGVISLEKVGTLRKWEVEEQSFAVTVSEILTKQIEQNQRQAAEANLILGEKRMASLIENASDAIAISDVDVNFFYASPAVEFFLGYTPKEFTRLNGAKLVHPQHRKISGPAADCLKNPGHPVSTEFLFKHKNGKYVFLEITFYNLLSDEAVKGVVMNFRDITARKRDERNLLKVNYALKKSRSMLQQKVEEQEKTLRLFKKYVPEAVVQKAMETSEDSILEGETRRATVLFCDIRGFTPMSEQMRPKEVVSFLNEYYSIMTQVVKNYHGTVTQFVGDEIFATFGAPVDHPDNEANAVLCSLKMMDNLEYLSVQANRKIEMGIGINSGEVVAGNLGSEDRIGYSVSGDTVNTEKRIESLSKDFGNIVLISRSVFEKTSSLINTKAWEPVQVKGKKEKILVHEVIGLKQQPILVHPVAP